MTIWYKLKKEYVGRINQIIPVGWRGGLKIFCVQYRDWTEEEMTEVELEAKVLDGILCESER